MSRIRYRLEIELESEDEHEIILTPDEGQYLSGLFLDAADAFGERRTKQCPIRLVIVPPRDADDAPPADEGPPDGTSDEPADVWRCGEEGCDWTGEDAEAQRAHKATVHGEGFFPCDHEACDFEAISEHGLRAHKRTHESRSFKCSWCDFLARSEAGRAAHERHCKKRLPRPTDERSNPSGRSNYL